MLNSYDLCLAWNWEYDADFVRLLNSALGAQGLSCLEVTPKNLQKVLPALETSQITFRSFFDRASDNDKTFLPLINRARQKEIYYINPHDQASWTSDKSAMHLSLIGAGIHTPYTFILPSYKDQPKWQPVDLSPLGESFTIKPAHGGGGEGVVLEATRLEQVFKARREFPDDKYLLQAHIFPVHLNFRPAWFRVICCSGEIYPSWWDTCTRVYTPVTPAEEERLLLSPLRQITATIARISGLELFSTEIALTQEGFFIVVDYLNDQIDLRLQSKTADGVPDYIVSDIAARLAKLVANLCPAAVGAGLKPARTAPGQVL